MNLQVIAGTDEAGRGPLAGPVVAAAVILTRAQRDILVACGLRDSKKMTEKARERLFEKICEIGFVWRAQAATPKRIDNTHILAASLWCMRRAVEQLPVWPDLTLVDGNQRIPGLMSAQKFVIKGDDKVPAISAASVAAKVLRDRIMITLDTLYPEYQFAKHKGYPSALHRDILTRIGPSSVHRLSFRGVISNEP